MMRFVYTLVLYVLMPLILLRLLYRSLKSPLYRSRIAERFGFVSQALADGDKPLIWLHAVSVGETLAAIPLIRQLQQRYPQHRILVSNTTPTGAARVQAELGDSVEQIYAPYDLPDVVARALRRVRPVMYLVMETELWPNMIAACIEQDIPVLVANARLSERSFKGYQRFAGLSRNMLKHAQVLAQSEADAQRFRQLGAESVSVTGSIKFDIDISSSTVDKAEKLQQLWKPVGQAIWMAGSTRDGEDELVLQAFAQLKAMMPELLLLLVPRHPERLDSVEALCLAQGFRVIRRSENAPSVGVDIILGDTMGEMLALYGCCDVAFVGGSLVEKGCHNVIEPAMWAKPVVTGPHVFNFADIVAQLVQANGQSIVNNADELAARVSQLLSSKELCHTQGKAALAVVQGNRGALERLLANIDQCLPTELH